MMPSHEKKMIMMIMMIKLPWRGRAETFPHTTEAEPKLSFFKIRISNAIAIVVILTYDEQQLSSPAQSSSASQVSWSSVRASSVASWHHHHPDISVIQTSSSSWYHHHPDIIIIQTSASSRHHHHPDIIIIQTSSSSRHQRHRHLDFIEPSADATVILKWHLENFSTNPLLTWLLTPTDNTKINTSDLNMADLWRLQGWCFWLLSWFWFWIIRNQCIALYSFKAKWDK